MNAHFERYADHYRVVFSHQPGQAPAALMQALRDEGWFESRRSRQGYFQPGGDFSVARSHAVRDREFDRDGSGICGMWNAKQYDEFLIPARDLLVAHGCEVAPTVDRRQRSEIFANTPARI